jgi:hypothetical protein
MGSRRGRVITIVAVVVLGSAVAWALRRWTDHDVSDPGVTL